MLSSSRLYKDTTSAAGSVKVRETSEGSVDSRVVQWLQRKSHRICGKWLKRGFEEKGCLSDLGVLGITKILVHFSESAPTNPQNRVIVDTVSGWWYLEQYKQQCKAIDNQFTGVLWQSPCIYACKDSFVDKILFPSRPQTYHYRFAPFVFPTSMNQCVGLQYEI